METKQIERSVIYKTILITILLLLSLYSTRYILIGICVGLLEIAILYILFLKKDLKNYIILYIVFLVTSFEVPLFVSGDSNTIIYSFIRLPVIKTYHLIVLLYMPTILLLIKGFNKLKTKDHKILKRFVLCILTVYFFSVISMFLSLILNDNGILNTSIFWEFLRGDIFRHSIALGIIVNLTLLLLIDSSFSKYLEKWLLSILVSLCLLAPISILLGFNGNYGNRDAILLPLGSFFGIMLLTFPFYQKYKRKKILILLGFIILLSMLYLPSPLGGKWWLLLFLVFLIIGMSFYRSSKYRKKFIINVLVTIILVPLLVIMVLMAPMKDNTFGEESLHQLKFEQAIQTISVWEEGWFLTLPQSPKFRIDEFINVWLEYKEKPQYFLFGKGLGGSTQHHTNFLNWDNKDAFTEEQIQANIYFDLHETVNVFFLKFGLFGLIILFSTLYVCFRNIFNNPWLLIGAVWLLFYYGIYYSMLLGASSLILGLYQLNEKGNSQTIKE